MRVYGTEKKTVYAADLQINYKGAHRVVVGHPLPTTLCSALYHDEEMVNKTIKIVSTNQKCTLAPITIQMVRNTLKYQQPALA